MSDKTDLRCDACGASLDSASEGGVCASCAFQAALEVHDEEGTVHPPGPAAPEIPGYDVRELLGRGGMGAVWRAEQRQPVRREVAIKVIPAGEGSEETAARFHAERQALAMLDHPHVARLFDAGTTPDGRPYFVMEHVPGVPITEFCNERRMTLEERVKLFSTVCDTVHHAHQKGLIHRDLKPSNILVLDREGRPEPKVIDFGVAKAMRPRVFDHTGMTRADQLLGTPEYMSPEQLARGEVDVQSDVYALGAILYELLAGGRPFDREMTSGAGLEEVLRRVREDEPPTPSDRVTSLGEAGREAARTRATAPAALVSKLRGDLDWITMKALEKDRNRRYESAAAFADDQRRYLRHEPVTAGPPGAGYRARTFVRRHPVAAASGAILAASLVVFAVAMADQARRVARERDRANEQAAVSRQVTDFLADLFRVSDPSEARGNEITAREVLDRGAARILEDVTDPAVRAELVGEMGVIYSNLGLTDEAMPLLREAAELHEELRGRDDERTLDVLHELAIVFKNTGQAAEAESLLAEVVERWRRRAGEEDARFLNALTNLAILYRQQSRMEEAEDMLIHILETRRTRGEEDEPGTLAAMSNLGTLYMRTHRYDEAAPLLEEVRERRRRVLGEDHPQTLASGCSLGELRMHLERYDEAEALLRETAEAQRRVQGPDHPNYGITLENLAQVQFFREDYDGAAEAFSGILENRRAALGPEHPLTFVAMHNLSAALSFGGHLAEAESVATRALESCRRHLGDDHRYTLGLLYVAGHIAAQRGNRERALDRLREAARRGLSAPDILDNEAFERLRDDPEFGPVIEAIRGNGS
jgi:non-specific serine/threonine protein kinase/serine/threonine-protein kinase